jgi:UBA-like domain/LysM domain
MGNEPSAQRQRPERSRKPVLEPGRGGGSATERRRATGTGGGKGAGEQTRQKLAADAADAGERYDAWRAKLDAAVEAATSGGRGDSGEGGNSGGGGVVEHQVSAPRAGVRLGNRDTGIGGGDRNSRSRSPPPEAAPDDYRGKADARGSRNQGGNMAAERSPQQERAGRRDAGGGGSGSGSGGATMPGAGSSDAGRPRREPIRRETPEDWLIHEISPHDTLPGLALKYGVDVASIKQANRLYSNDSFGFLDKVVIPVSASEFLSAKNLLKTNADGSGASDCLLLPRSKEDRSEWFVVRERDDRTYVVHADVDRADLVQRFVRISGCGTDEVARSFLERKAWNFAQALGSYFAHAGEAEHAPAAEPFENEWGDAQVADDVRERFLSLVESTDEEGGEGGAASRGLRTPPSEAPQPFHLTPEEMARASRFVIIGKDEEDDDETQMRRGARYDETAIRVERPALTVQRSLQDDADDIFGL